MASEYEDFALAIQAHDRAVAGLGMDVWCGTEPTFTDRFSEAPEWTNTALGGDKEARARLLVRRLRQRLGGLVLRTIGRQYPGEDRARWNYGIYARRDGTPVWDGPPDPMQLEEQAFPGDAWEAQAFQEALVNALGRRGLVATGFSSADGTLRVRFHWDLPPPLVRDDDPRLHCPSIHARSIDLAGLRDPLAEAGIGLLVLDTLCEGDRSTPRIELPAFDSPERFAQALAAIGEASNQMGLPALILRGHPPPVNDHVQWTTITPDPAVIEVNMAPYSDIASLLAAKQGLYQAAGEVGLAPYRLQYNGAVADSGGGGQITLGGPSPAASPFLLHPELLPALVRYCNHHPALSYLFAHDYLGGAGQAVRADERGPDALYELRLALALLAGGTTPTPEKIGSGLAQFMTDNCGNSHRAELNIEKLWNPLLPGRGRSGLVEFRAFRMQHSPERAAALAALLRSVVAMLAARGFGAPLRDWGEELHERFALPFFLSRDLESIFVDLELAGTGLAPALAENLLQCDGFRDWASLEHEGCTLRVRRALEFWPLVGDAGTQERGDSRLIDSSTARIELCLRPTAPDTEEPSRWQVALDGMRLPLRQERDASGPAGVLALRYRGFVPYRGLHPALGKQGPLQLILFNPDRDQAVKITLHEWRPDNTAYPGLPPDLSDARERRRERCVVEPAPVPRPEALGSPPPGACTPYTVDLRWPRPVD